MTRHEFIHDCYHFVVWEFFSYSDTPYSVAVTTGTPVVQIWMAEWKRVDTAYKINWDKAMKRYAMGE